MEDLQSMKEKIFSFGLAGSDIGSMGYARVLLQVCGRTGHGKSSFINSVRYALLGGQFVTAAPEATATASQGGFTQKRTSYPLTEVIVLVDNRGFGKSDSYEKEEVYAQLGNLQPLDEEVVWEQSFETRMTEITEAKHNTNDLLLPIFIHSAQCTISDEEREEYREFLQNAKKLTEFQPIIILTKKSLGDAEAQKRHFEDLGMDNIFLIENYTSNDNIKTLEKDKSFLSILDQALEIVSFRSKNASSFGTPQEEHIKRVQMVLRIAHKNELERESERLQAEYDRKLKGRKPKKHPCTTQ